MRLHYIFAVTIGVALAGSILADENVRAVQTKLRDSGFYSGEIDGAYSAQLAEALTRYQKGNGLPVTGQLDLETSNVLGARPAVTKNRVDVEQSPESARLPGQQRQTSANRQQRRERADQLDEEVRPAENSQDSAPVRSETATQSTAFSPGNAPIPAQSTNAASASAVPQAPVSQGGSSEDEISTERLRDYVGAFVRAGVDPNIGMEADFFADRARYYDQGVIDREQIRNDLQNYAAHWPERHFRFAGNLTIEQQRGHRVRVTFPLQYELRNGPTQSSGTVNKTVVLEPAGDDLKIVAVSEQRPE